jgi:hypothetical protein
MDMDVDDKAGRQSAGLSFSARRRRFVGRAAELLLVRFVLC